MYVNGNVIGVCGLGQSVFALPLGFDYSRDNSNAVCPRPTKGLRFHDRVTETIIAAKKMHKKTGRKVLILGSSAGGLAALKAGAELGSSAVAGVVAVAPAPCGSIFPTAWECFWRMLRPRYMWPILTGKVFDILPGDFRAVALNGLSQDEVEDQIRYRISLSGKECFDLLFNSRSKALMPELLVGIPTLLVLGTEDRWVRPGGQEAMLKYFNMHGLNPDVIRVRAGHMPCHTGDKWVEEQVVGWVRKLQ